MAVMATWCAIGLLGVGLLFLASYTLELKEQLIHARADMINFHDDLCHQQVKLTLLMRERAGRFEHNGK